MLKSSLNALLINAITQNRRDFLLAESGADGSQCWSKPKCQCELDRKSATLNHRKCTTWINVFLKSFQKDGHTMAHFDAAVCGHISCVSQTNVVRRECCFFSSILVFCQSYRRCRTKRFIFSILEEDTAMYQCIAATKSLQTLSLNNMLVKCIFPHTLLFFPLWWIVSKQHNAVNGCSVLQVNVLH